ncbi:MAG: type II toxin-antitoxin system HicA family toxin [Anaerolineales bacterium]|nr:type II toxin-antitoxin system HicA family toxin [Anaerolineales bacterium]
MNYTQLVRRLRELNCEFYRQAAGAHEIWWHPATGRRTVVSNHGSKDIPKGTLRAIAKDLGLVLDELLRKKID